MQMVWLMLLLLLATTARGFVLHTGQIGGRSTHVATASVASTSSTTATATAIRRVMHRAESERRATHGTGCTKGRGIHASTAAHWHWNANDR